MKAPMKELAEKWLLRWCGGKDVDGLSFDRFDSIGGKRDFPSGSAVILTCMRQMSGGKKA